MEGGKVCDLESERQLFRRTKRRRVGEWESGSEGEKERRTRRDEATIAMPDEAKASTTVGPGVGVNDIRSWSRRITMCSYTSMWLLEMKYQ